MAGLTRGLRERPESSSTPPPKVIDVMIDAAIRNLLSQRRDDGHWCAELEGDTILESEYVLLLHWAIYPDGPTDPSVSVKAYLCLKTRRRPMKARGQARSFGGF